MPEGGRRLAAIMFTDMVGYTALTQANEALALEVLARHHRLVRPIFPKFSGREVKTIGDSFLVEFDSALDATNCAVEIQKFLRDYNTSSKDEWKVRLRIGIHLGDVVHLGEDVLGDAVNIASRIEPLAEAEGVCVSEQVFDQVRNKVPQPILKLPQKDLKNVQFHIDVYRVVMPWEEMHTKEVSDEKHSPLRIAVLPFANMSPDHGDEYFADGMTEELIDRLSQVRELKVIARTSVMGYKKKEKKVSEIADELGVGTVVEGSVRKAGNKIRVTVQLIRADTEDHLWSSRYDKELDDVFAVQSEISEKVTQALRVQLVDSEKRLLERRPTENTEAYTLYLKGRYCWNERNLPMIEKGIGYLQQAIRLDPNMALAYSDLADAYVVMADYGMMPAAIEFNKVQEFASKALGFDPTLSQPHASLAGAYDGNFQWTEGEKHFKLAIELNPSNVTARHWYALHLFFQGRRSSAKEQWRKALELDPLSLIVGSAFGYYLFLDGQKEEGLEMQRGVVEMNESFVWAHRNLALTYLLLDEKTRAVEEAKKIMALGAGAHEYLSHVAAVYACAGLIDEATSILDKLLRESEAHYTDPAYVAMVYAALGDQPDAMRWLEKAVSEKSHGVTYIRVWPGFFSLRENPRFRELAKQVGLGYGF